MVLLNKGQESLKTPNIYFPGSYFSRVKSNKTGSVVSFVLSLYVVICLNFHQEVSLAFMFMSSQADKKHKSFQELDRFMHYYTRYKNHEHSYQVGIFM